MVYSPIVPRRPPLVTNRFEPETAIPDGPKLNPEIKEAFTVVPEVVYSPIVFVPNRKGRYQYSMRLSFLPGIP